MPPSVPAPARALFADLCASPAETDVPALRTAVAAHLEDVRKAAKRNELLPIDIAETLAAALDSLLDQLPTLKPEHGSLVVGAARYFCADDDHVNDLSGVLGLDDDVAVFNHVVRRIGRTDLLLAE
jgi:hypothetical protein